MYKCLSWDRKGTGTASEMYVSGQWGDSCVSGYGVAEIVANGDETAGMA